MKADIGRQRPMCFCPGYLSCKCQNVWFKGLSDLVVLFFALFSQNKTRESQTWPSRFGIKLFHAYIVHFSLLPALLHCTYIQRSLCRSACCKGLVPPKFVRVLGAGGAATQPLRCSGRQCSAGRAGIGALNPRSAPKQNKKTTTVASLNMLEFRGCWVYLGFGIPMVGSEFYLDLPGTLSPWNPLNPQPLLESS